MKILPKEVNDCYSCPYCNAEESSMWTLYKCKLSGIQKIEAEDLFGVCPLEAVTYPEYPEDDDE